MHKLGERITGAVELRVTGAAPAGFLNECARCGLRLLRADPADPLTILCTVRSSDRRRAEEAAVRACCETELLREYGSPRLLRRLRRRAAACMAGLAVFSGLFAASLFLWEIEVTENDSPLPESRILAVLDRHGVGIGSFWPGMRADMIAAAVLPELPGTGSLTVNVHGSRAEVIVHAERKPPQTAEAAGEGDLLSRCSGIVTEITALEGESAVQLGNTVMKGDVLIHGSRGGGLSPVRSVRAAGRVLARTWHTITAVCPKSELVRTEKGRPTLRPGLLVGKRLLFFERNSRISAGSCDRIQNIYTLRVRNVFSLPLSAVSETFVPVSTVWEQISPASAELLLRECAERELALRLEGVGEAVGKRFVFSEGGDSYTLTLFAECVEEIGERSGR